jgi:hypothetical protein
MGREDETVANILEERSITSISGCYRFIPILLPRRNTSTSRKVKLMIDEIGPLHIIITGGSSAFDFTAHEQTNRWWAERLLMKCSQWHGGNCKTENHAN